MSSAILSPTQFAGFSFGPGANGRIGKFGCWDIYSAIKHMSIATLLWPPILCQVQKPSPVSLGIHRIEKAFVIFGSTHFIQ